MSRANRAIGRSAIARGARCAPRARAGMSGITRVRVTVDRHGASRPGCARAPARREVQARETYRGHDESTTLGGLAHLHSLEVGSAAGAGAGGGGPRDDARGHRGGNNSGHFSWCAVGMCSGACGNAGTRASPALRVSRSEKQTPRLYPKAQNLPAKHTSLSKKGSDLTGSRFGFVREAGSWAQFLPKIPLTGTHTKTRTTIEDGNPLSRVDSRVSSGARARFNTDRWMRASSTRPTSDAFGGLEKHQNKKLRLTLVVSART